jgi:methyl-accepting chemotaxis protein
MLRIADLKYKTKLSLIAGAAILGIITVAALSFAALNKVKIGGDLYKLQALDQSLSSDLSPAALSLMETRKNLLMIEDGRDPTEISRLLGQVKQAEVDFEDKHAYYAAQVKSPKLLQLLNGKVYTLGKNYFEILDTEYLPLIRASKFDQARVLRRQKLAPLSVGQAEFVDELYSHTEERLKENEAAAASAVSNSEQLMILVALAVLGGVGSLVFVISRHINIQIGKLQVAAKALADGDMTHRIVAESGDELGEVGRALNKSFERVGEAIAEITRHSETIASASDEISSSATQISSSSELQKQQVTQVATAMHEMTSTVMQVSDNSRLAADNAEVAGKVANDGGKVVEETIAVIRELADSTRATAQKIEELGKSSNAIGKIIGTIDDIADQTNLLALNAAIEAARAGEQGRGFAVVADEVRKLAERTSSATKEIAGMIENIQCETNMAVEAMRAGTAKVDAGVVVAGKAGQALSTIIVSAGEQHEMITQIATAATEQAATAEQVNGSMEQISKMVQQSAVGAGESAKACQDLSRLALDLQQVVSKFKIDGRAPVRREAKSTANALLHDPATAHVADFPMFQ